LRERPKPDTPGDGFSGDAPAGVTDVTEETLRRLVAGAAGGDAACLAEIHRLYGGRIRATIRRRMRTLLRRRYDSADLQQSVVTEVIRDLPGFEFRGRAAFEAWLMRKLRGKLAEKTRAVLSPGGGRREVSLAEDSKFGPAAPGEGPAEAAALREDAELLRAAVDSLPAISRDVLRLRHEDRLTFHDIAEQLGLASADAARKRYARALVRLGDAWPEE
jgi:RNA polymerase sigma factor (sigma-70 family)